MYSDKIIHNANLKSYNEYIPVNYHEQIKRGELSAVATYEGDPEDDILVGVSVLGSHAGWLEIVWVAMGENYRQDVKAADFVRYVIRRAKKTDNYVGAFCEIHMDENTCMHIDILLLAGMELREAKNNIYEIALSEVEHGGMLIAAAKNADCVFLEDIDEDDYEDLLGTVEEMIDEDERPVPSPPFFMWNSYEQNLSLVCLEDENPVGVLLFSVAKDYLVLELAYSLSPKNMPGMVGAALLKAKELYPPDKKILLPIVGKGAADIIAKLAPGARRGDMIQAVTWFKERKTGKALRFIFDKMKG